MTEKLSSLHPVPGSGRAMFTVDLEEYFQVGALRDWIPRAEWESLPSRAGWALDRLFEQLDAHGARATFFVSRWLLDARPELAARVADAGHEAAVLARPPQEHGAGDTREEFRRVAREARDRLEDVTGRRVHGYRTYGFQHPVPAAEAAAVLSELGYTYDSTLIDPTALPDHFGIERQGPVTELPLDGDGLLEVPPAVCDAGGRRLFTVGGTAFRVLPAGLIHRLLAREETAVCGGVFYMRSWEFDPEQPVLPVPFMSRVRLYWGLDRVRKRVSDLLDAFAFDSVAGALGLDVRTAGADGSGREPPDDSGTHDVDLRSYRRHG